jgi:hypothetical protein
VITICSLSVRRGCFFGLKGASSSRSRLILTLMLSVADRVIGGAGVSSESNRESEANSAGQLVNCLPKRSIYVQIVDDRFGRTGTLLHSGGEAINPDERLDGGSIGRSPSFSIQAHASLKFLVNIVGSDLFRTSSFTCPAAKK